MRVHIHFRALRTTIGLRQAIGQKNIRGKLKIDLIRRAKKAKSIESECQEVEDSALSEDTDWRKDRSRIQ